MLGCYLPDSSIIYSLRSILVDVCLCDLIGYIGYFVELAGILVMQIFQNHPEDKQYLYSVQLAGI